MSHKPYTIRPCKFCGNEFLGRGKAAKCDTCKFTCPNCNGKKKYQHSKYCYSCSLLFRDTSKYKDSIKKAQIAAKSIKSRRKRSKSIMGKNHPNWQGGISWRDSLKKSIRNRDNFTCQDCGRIHIPTEERHFDVHHVDFNSGNHTENNLVTLCRSCHKKRHS